MLWILYFAIVVGVLLLVIYGERRASRVVALLKKQEADFFTARFGARVISKSQGGETVANQVKCYRVLRESRFSSRLSDDQGGLLVVKSDVLIVDQADHYWHCLLTTIEKRTVTDMALTSLTELRARRALFNKPKLYIAAFGSPPQKSQLLGLGEASGDTSPEQ